GDDEVRGIGHPDDDRVTAIDAGGAELRGGPLHPGRQLCVREAPAGLDDGRLVGALRRPAPEEAGDRVGVPVALRVVPVGPTARLSQEEAHGACSIYRTEGKLAMR